MNMNEFLEELKNMKGIEELTEDNYDKIKENIVKNIKRTQMN